MADLQSRDIKYHLLMSEKVFPWIQPSQQHETPLHLLKATAACPVHFSLLENSGENGQSQMRTIAQQEVFLELREGHLAIYDPINQCLIDSYPTSVDLSFSLRQPQEFRRQQINGEQQKRQTFHLLQFTHSTLPKHRLTFLIPMEHHKTLEQFGTALEKCVIAQQDFHRKFKPLRKLGKGATASVYSALRHNDGAVMAVKAFNKSAHFSVSGGKGKRAFEKELRVLAQCTHENLCGYEGLFESENSLYLVMQNYERTLSSFLHTHQTIPRPLVIAIMRQLLRGIAHLHACGVMHRDLKLENIMFQKTESGIRIIIIDMGMAEFYHEKVYLFEQCGTPGYVAPEIFGPRPPHPQKCDIFSLGVLFHILLFKKPVFAGSNSAEVCQSNRAGKLNIDAGIENEDELVRDLLLRMLELDNSSRISASDALEHQLFSASTQADSEVETSRTVAFVEI